MSWQSIYSSPENSIFAGSNIFCFPRLHSGRHLMDCWLYSLFPIARKPAHSICGQSYLSVDGNEDSCTVNAWRSGSNQGLIYYINTKYKKKCSQTLWSSICILCSYWFSIYKRIKKQSTGQSLPLACFHCVFCFIMLLSCGAVWWWWWDYNFHCYLCCGELMMAGTDPGLAPANLIICCCTLHLRCQQSGDVHHHHRRRAAAGRPRRHRAGRPGPVPRPEVRRLPAPAGPRLRGVHAPGGGQWWRHRDQWSSLQDNLPPETVQIITYGAPEISTVLAMGLSGRDYRLYIVKLRRGSGKDRQGMALKAKGLKA